MRQQFREFWRDVRLMAKYYKSLRVPTGLPVQMQLRYVDRMINPPLLYSDELRLIGTTAPAVFRIPQ